MRNATLADMVALLTDQQARKLDVIAPASAITADEGRLIVAGADPIITDTGVTASDGVFTPTAVAVEGLAAKLNIPSAYLKRLHADRPDLWDENVNGWLHGDGLDNGPDPRSFMVRTFRGDVDGRGVARAFLSDTYRAIDNLDVLTATLAGVRDAGVDVEVDGCDLTDRRMHVRLKAPQVNAYAPELLAGYRSPFSGASGTDNPTVFAGFVLSNSEVGGGAFSITPRLVVEVCNNGMKITRDVLRAVHLGSKQDEGIIRWGSDTNDKSLELVTLRARDAVRTFLDHDYVVKAIARLSEKAQEPVSDAAATVTTVTKRLQFSEEQQKSVLDMFIQGGQMTTGGIANAITAYAQTVDDGDTASALEDAAVSVLV